MEGILPSRAYVMQTISLASRKRTASSRWMKAQTGVEQLWDLNKLPDPTLRRVSCSDHMGDNLLVRYLGY
jgi:hypothetical protein